MSRHDPPIPNHSEARLAAKLSEIERQMAEARSYHKSLPVEVSGYINLWRAAGGVGNFSPPMYFMDQNGVVHLEGLVDRAGNNWVASQGMFTLPVGSVGRNKLFIVGARGGGISGTAQVRIEGVGASETTVGVGDFGAPANPVEWLSLDTIWWRTR